MRVLIIYDHVGDDALPDQSDVLVQARAVSVALESLGHEWMTLGVTLDLQAAREAILRLQPDLVFNLVESLGGSGRLIHFLPAMLDTMGIPYTGASADAQFITSHKALAKELLTAERIATPDSMTLAKLRETVAIDVVEQCAGKRWILKSLWEHASVGLDDRSVVDSSHVPTILRELESRLERMGGSGFAEEYIDGREFNVSLLGGGDEVAPGLWMPETLPAAEIAFREPEAWGTRPRIVNYACKWNEQSFEYAHTERVFDFGDDDAPLLERMIQIARACWVIFELRGYARVDFRVDSKGDPWVLEVNSNPCLSPDSGFVAALERGNITYPRAIERILEDALRQPHAPSVTTP